MQILPYSHSRCCSTLLSCCLPQILLRKLIAEVTFLTELPDAILKTSPAPSTQKPPSFLSISISLAPVLYLFPPSPTQSLWASALLLTSPGLPIISSLKLQLSTADSNFVLKGLKGLEYPGTSCLQFEA